MKGGSAFSRAPHKPLLAPCCEHRLTPSGTVSQGTHNRKSAYSWCCFLTPKILIYVRQVMCPHHSKLQLSLILDQLTHTEATNVPPPRTPHTPCCCSFSLRKQTKGAAAQSLPVSHTNTHSSAKQVMFSPEANTAPPCRSPEMGKG